MTISSARWPGLHTAYGFCQLFCRPSHLRQTTLAACAGLILALIYTPLIRASDPICDQEQHPNNAKVAGTNAPSKLILSPEIYSAIQARCRRELAQKRLRPPLSSLQALLNFGFEDDRPYLETLGFTIKNPGAAKQAKRKHTKGKSRSNTSYKPITASYYTYPDPTWDWVMEQFEFWLSNGSPIHDFKPSPRPQLKPHTNFSKLNLCLKTPADAWCFAISWTLHTADALSILQNAQPSFVSPTTTEVKNVPIHPEQRQFMKDCNTYAFVIPLVPHNAYKLITQCIFSLKIFQSRPYFNTRENNGMPNLAFEEAELEVNCDLMGQKEMLQKLIYVHGACDFTLNADLCSREQGVSLSFSCSLDNCDCHKNKKLPGRSLLRIRAV